MNITESTRRKAYINYVRNKVSEMKFIKLSFSVFINREGNIKKYIGNYIEEKTIIRGDNLYNVEKAKILYSNYLIAKKIDENLPKKIYNAFYKGTAPENDVLHSIHVLFSSDMDYSGFCTNLDKKNPDYLKYIIYVNKSEDINSITSQESETSVSQIKEKVDDDEVLISVKRNEINIKISADFIEFKPGEFVNSLKLALNLLGGIDIIGMKSGSVILFLAMDSNDYKKVISAFKSGELKKFNVIDVTINKTSEGESNLVDTSLEVLSNSQVRIKKLKELFMQIKSTEKLSDLEKEPAFVRKNIILNESSFLWKSQDSQLTLSEDDKILKKNIRLPVNKSNDSKTHYNVNFSHLKKDIDIEKVLKSLEDIFKTSPYNPDVNFCYALLILEKFNNIDGAKKHFEIALKYDPDSAGKHYYYAKLLEKINDSNGARKHFECSLKLNPDNSDAQYDYAVLLLEKFKCIDEAKIHFLIAIKLDPYIKGEINTPFQMK